MVPTIAPPLAVAPRDECAIPKSMISAWPSFDDDVFRLEVAMDDADVVRRRHAVGDLARQRQACGTGSRPRLMSAASVSPSTKLIVMYLRPPTSPRSWMRTTFL